MDLNDALRGLHRDFEDRAADPASGPIVAAARRRRTVARTGYATVGTGLVAALVLGGLALADREPPLPPATTSPTSLPSTPTTTPTPSATPTPTAPAFAPDLSACGETFPDDYFDPTVDLQVFVADYYDTAEDEPIAFPLTVQTTQDWGGDPVAVDLRELVLTREDPDSVGWVIVGVAATPLPEATTRTFDPWTEGGGAGSSTWLDVSQTFVMCEGEDGAGGPPPTGWYDVFARVSVEHAGAVLEQWGAVGAAVGGAEPPWAGQDAPEQPELPATVDVSADVPACGSRYALDEVRYVEGQPLPEWYLALDAFHLGSATPGVAPWGVSTQGGPLDDASVYGYSDLVALLVRRSDGLVVARTETSALPQHVFWESPSLWFPSEYSPFPMARLQADAGSAVWWTPVGCADLGGGIQTGVAFDPGGWDDDHGFTLHVGQRVTLGDGTVQWYWASRNPNDPVYAP